MTNKRFDWMTPDEAEKELISQEPVFVVYESEVLVGQFVFSLYLDDYSIALAGDDTRHHLTDFSKICRAIVPEVPHE